MTQPGTLPVLPSPRFPKQQLISIIKLAAGTQVVWDTDARRRLGNQPMTEKAWVVMGMQSYRNVGIDEKRFQWNPNTNRNDTVVVANREFTLNLVGRSIDPSLEAFDLLERVRFRMRTAQVRALMTPTIALRDIQPTHNLNSVVSDGRLVLQSTMDIRMLTVLFVDPEDPNSGGWIQTWGDNAGVIGTYIP